MKSFAKDYRNVLIVLFITLVICDTSYAQSKVQVGPFWGQGMRMITGNEEADIGFGYHGGIMARIPVDKQFSVVPSVSFSRKGYYSWDLGWWDEDNVNVYNQKLTYTDIYLPFKYEVAGIFTMQAGFQVGFLLDAALIIDSYEYGGKFKKNIKSELNPVDFGFVVGAGVQFKNGIGLDLIVNQGLTKVYENDPPIYFDSDGNYFYDGSEFDGKNLLTTINVYYLFGYVKPVVK